MVADVSSGTPIEGAPELRTGRAGWVRAARLADPHSPALAHLLHRWQQQQPGIPPRARATQWLRQYTRAIANWTIESYLRDGALPLMPQTSLWLHVTQAGTIQGIALEGKKSPLTRESPPEAHRLHLWQWLVDEHLAGVMQQLHRLTKMPLRTQRLLVRDTLAQIFVRTGRRSGEDERCRREMACFFAQGEWPQPRLCEAAPGVLVVENQICCLKHVGTEKARCAACPARTALDRKQCLCSWAERESHQEE